MWSTLRRVAIRTASASHSGFHGLVLLLLAVLQYSTRLCSSCVGLLARNSLTSSTNKTLGICNLLALAIKNDMFIIDDMQKVRCNITSSIYLVATQVMGRPSGRRLNCDDRRRTCNRRLEKRIEGQYSDWGTLWIFL